MSTSEISKTIAKSTAPTKATQKDILERQVEAAQFYGVIPSDNNPVPEKRPRGRPPNKPKSPRNTPGNSPERNQQGIPKVGKKPTDERVNKILEEMTRSRLIQKLRAYAAYWPDICNSTLSNTNIYECTNEQLERICKGFEDSVQCQSEIVDIPRSFKAALGKLEPVAVGIGLGNPNNPFLSQLTKLNGFARALHNDPSVDRNIKLLSIRFMGRMPKHPFLNLIWSIFMVGLDVYKNNVFMEDAEIEEQEDQNQYGDL